MRPAILALFVFFMMMSAIPVQSDETDFAEMLRFVQAVRQASGPFKSRLLTLKVSLEGSKATSVDVVRDLSGDPEKQKTAIEAIHVGAEKAHFAKPIQLTLDFGRTTEDGCGNEPTIYFHEVGSNAPSFDADGRPSLSTFSVELGRQLKMRWWKLVRKHLPTLSPGRVEVDFTLDAGGRTVAAQIIRPHRHPHINEFALEVLNSFQPKPVAPPQPGIKTLRVTGDFSAAGFMSLYIRPDYDLPKPALRDREP